MLGYNPNFTQGAHASSDKILQNYNMLKTKEPLPQYTASLKELTRELRDTALQNGWPEPSRKLVSILIADDAWPAIAAVAMPLIRKYGLPALKSIF
jgi:hypothetical protein